MLVTKYCDNGAVQSGNMLLLQLLIGAVAGGLGGAIFTWITNRKFRLPPVLSMRLVRREGEKGRIAREGAYENARYYHMRVSNSRRWTTATDVQVFVLRLEEPGPNGVFQPTWIGDVPMRWRNQESSPLTRTIGAAADCDLCSVGEQGWLALMPLITPYSMTVQKNEKWRVALFLQARSTQADSPTYRVEVAWDGVWEPGDAEIQRHVTFDVTQVQEQ